MSYPGGGGIPFAASLVSRQPPGELFKNGFSMATRIFNVLNLGAGIQSSRIFLGMCHGEMPKPDAAIFADTQWEPAAVYENLKFLASVGMKAGIPITKITAGDIRQDAIDFRQLRQSKDGKRYAALPLFTKNPNGTIGVNRRQCTSEYKIRPVERWIRTNLLGLKLRQRTPKGVLVRHWFGISADEPSRCAYPGLWKLAPKAVIQGFFGPIPVKRRKEWRPTKWRHSVYPLLNEVWKPERTIVAESILPNAEYRGDCKAWLEKHYPGRTFPRSACIGCPFRSNAEWRDMRDNRPDEWKDACEFDELQRVADGVSANKKGLLVGKPYVHRQCVPLAMVDLDGIGEKGGGCGTLLDGMDGLCDV